MVYSLIWLPHVLKEAGLKVAVMDGWQERGHGDVGPIHGVICHHTATSDRHSNMPTLHLLQQGRPDLAGPLAQLGLGGDSVFGAGTEAALRALQRQHGMVADGIAGPKTWLLTDTLT